MNIQESSLGKTSAAMVSDLRMMPEFLRLEKYRAAMKLYHEHSKSAIDLLVHTDFGTPTLVYEVLDERTGLKRHKIVNLESPAEADRKVQLRKYLIELRRQCFKAVGYPLEEVEL
jgi:hypothetical protein